MVLTTGVCARLGTFGSLSAGATTATSAVVSSTLAVSGSLQLTGSLQLGSAASAYTIARAAAAPGNGFATYLQGQSATGFGGGTCACILVLSSRGRRRAQPVSDLSRTCLSRSGD